MENKPLVSVIIPLYNCERFIGDCIRSVTSQRYANIEVIVVDDGSSDGGVAVVEHCMRRDSRITCIVKSHEGLPLARRTGLLRAEGKYIQHLDADDELLTEALERLVERAEQTDADIVAAPFCYCYRNAAPKRSSELRFDALTGSEYYHEVLADRACWSVWSNFQKSSLAKDPSVRVVPEISHGEDLILMTQLILKARKVVSLSDPVLNYNRHDASITSQMNLAGYREELAAYCWTEEYLREKGLEGVYVEDLVWRHMSVVFWKMPWLDREYIAAELVWLSEQLKKYPNLESRLSSKQKKIMSLYRINPLLGRLKVIYYQLKRRWKQ